MTQAASASASAAKPAHPVSLQKRAGLHLPVRAIKRRINDAAQWKIVCGPEAAIYLTALLEYTGTFIVDEDSRASCKYSVDFADRRGVVTSNSVDGLMVRDPTRTYATLMRRTVPFNAFSVRVHDAKIIATGLARPKRVKKAKVAPAAPAAEEDEEEEEEKAAPAAAAVPEDEEEDDGEAE